MTTPQIFAGAMGSSSGVDVGDNVPNSLLLDSSLSQYLSRTPSVATNRNIFWYSAWVKRATLTGVQPIFTAGSDDSNKDLIRFTSDNFLEYISVAGGVTQGDIISTRLFRDPTSYFHLFAQFDFTQATAADRVKMWVNGDKLSFTTQTTITGVGLHLFNSTVEHRIGRGIGTVQQSELYIAYAAMGDGNTKAATDFGRFSPDTGGWVPKNYTGTYGTNGFKLEFLNGTALGTDTSGNGNNWTVNGGITSANQYRDTPTNNYTVLNALYTGKSTLSKGNLTASGATDLPTLSPTSGSWYFEINGASTTWTPPAAFPSAAGVYNFGQRSFNNTATHPTLCTANLVDETVILSGTFTGNASADGRFVFCNGYPTTLTINGYVVTFGTHADRVANGFKLRTSSASYNAVGTNTWTATIVGNRANCLKYARAQVNP